MFFERVLETAWPRSHQKIYGGGSCASVSATITYQGLIRALGVLALGVSILYNHELLDLGS